MKISTITTALLATLICSSSFLMAQEYTQKGHYMIGGGLRFNISDEDYNQLNAPNALEITSTNSTFSIFPYAGKFVKDNLLLGLKLITSISNSESHYDYTTYSRSYDNRAQNYGLAILLKRYYQIKDKFGGFVQPEIGYTYSYSLGNNHREEAGTITYEVESTDNRHRIALGARAGLYYFISKNFSLEATFVKVDINQDFIKSTYYDTNVDISEETSSKGSHIGFDFENINQMLTINYYF